MSQELEGGGGLANRPVEGSSPERVEADGGGGAERVTPPLNVRWEMKSSQIRLNRERKQPARAAVQKTRLFLVRQEAVRTEEEPLPHRAPKQQLHAPIIETERE